MAIKQKNLIGTIEQGNTVGTFRPENTTGMVGGCGSDRCAGKVGRNDGKPGWNLPVSQRFYESLMERVDEVLVAVFVDPAPEYYRNARRLINAYLRDNLHSIPKSRIIPEVWLIFLTLKAEIDAARQRSTRARERAHARAALKRATLIPASAPRETSLNQKGVSGVELPAVKRRFKNREDILPPQKLAT